MKTIGIIGGMSWESSREYYGIINEEIKRRLGGLHSAQSLMFSFDFAEIEKLQAADRWDEATHRMVEAARNLEKGGADFIIISSNTMHKMALEVQKGTSIPFLHIADPTAEAIKARGIRKVGLLGTKYTMEHDFYKGRLIEQFGLDVLVPEPDERKLINDVIYNELCVGEIREASKAKYLEIIKRLEERGVEGVILGCTEIGLLIKQADTKLPLFDTARLHAEAAAAKAI